MSRNYAPDPKGLLNPEDYQYYRSQRQRVRDTYNLSTAQNAHEQKVVRNELSRQLGDYARKFQRSREGLHGRAIRGGLMNSGIWQRQLANFASDRAQAMSNVRGRADDSLGGLRLARDQLDHILYNQTVDFNAQEAARRAAVEAARAGGG